MKKAKSKLNFITKTLIFLLLPTFVLFFLSPITLIYAQSNNYLSNINLIHNALKINRRKLVLLGGSNLGWGVNSIYLEETIGIDVINYGLHAGLGLDFLLSDLNRFINNNDIVVIALEYEHFNDNFHKGDQETLYLTNSLCDDCTFLDFFNQRIFEINNFDESLYSIFLNRIISDKYDEASIINSNSFT